jgi:hypothetical protein
MFGDAPTIAIEAGSKNDLSDIPVRKLLNQTS